MEGLDPNALIITCTYVFVLYIIARMSANSSESTNTSEVITPGGSALTQVYLKYRTALPVVGDFISHVHM